MADPTARNEVCAHHALEVAVNRPTTLASRLTCPLLMQVGTDDDVVPPLRRGAPRRTPDIGHTCVNTRSTASAATEPDERASNYAGLQRRRHGSRTLTGLMGSGQSR
jgi:hypothetical protein